MAAAEWGGLEHPTPGISLPPGTVTCCPARIHLEALGTGPMRSLPLWDLGEESVPSETASLWAMFFRTVSKYFV